MDAIILAGGLGTRLRPVVDDVPKCLAPVCGKPFLHYLFSYLQKEGIRRIILSLGYLHEKVEQWVEQGDYDLEYIYSIEDTPLGTGGAIKRALSHVQSEQVMILNGDTFFHINLPIFHMAHLASGATLSLALKPMEDFDRYGNVIIDADGYISHFREKQYCAQGLINGGVYLMQTRNDWMEQLPDTFSFETEVLQPHARRKEIHGYTNNGYFIDIGIPSDYEKANNDFRTLFP